MKRIIISFFLISINLIGAVIFSLNNYDIEEIIICSSNNDANYIPSNICKYYLFNYRGNKNDVTRLSKTSNLSFLINIENKELREALFDYFIEKGSDINGLSNTDGLTPLHAAILVNDSKLVKYLLHKGADPAITDRDNQLTAIQFLQLLTSKTPETNRKEIKSLLKPESKNL